jgi:hypothetical protein
MGRVVLFPCTVGYLRSCPLPQPRIVGNGPMGTVGAVRACWYSGRRPFEMKYAGLTEDVIYYEQHVRHRRTRIFTGL